MSLYLNVNQQQVGPYEVAQVNQMLQSAQINLETLGWKDGMANWEPLASPTFSAIGIRTASRTMATTATTQQVQQKSNPVQDPIQGGGSFSIGSAVGEAFTFFKANAIGSIGWLVITGALSSTGVGFLLTPLLGVNFLGCAKRFQETGKKMELGELFDFTKAVEKIFGPIIIGFIIGLGFVCLIIPGLIFSIWWTFSPCVLADRPDLSFTEAMKKSRLVAKGNWINLILLFIVLGLLQILGAICLGIGLLVTIPVGHVALYFAYAQCKK
jgi:hypothetical protein